MYICIYIHTYTYTYTYTRTLYTLSKDLSLPVESNKNGHPTGCVRARLCSTASATSTPRTSGPPVRERDAVPYAQSHY